MIPGLPAAKGYSLPRPTKPLISRSRAVKAALSVIDVQGLEALSLQEVARRMGVKAPSLYHHFRDKNELLEEVARSMLLEVEAPRLKPNDDWRDVLFRLAVETRRTILRHPNAAPLLLQKLPRHVLLAAYDHWIGMCAAPPEIHLMISEGMENIAMGSALFAAASIARGIDKIPAFDKKKLPHLAKAIRSNIYDDEEMFEEILHSFLRGLPTAESLKQKPARPAGEARKKAKRKA